MTVNTTSIVSGPYAGNGVADTFSYTFKIEDKSQLAVYETDDAGVETLLTVDVDYTVAGIGNDAGGTVTRVAGALPNNYELLIRSDYKYTQLTAFESQGAFFPDLHENAFDKLTFLNQQILDKLSRGPVVSDTYTGTLPLSLPNPVSERFLRWKSDLTGFENFDITAIGALAVSDFAKTYLDELTASATRAVLETKESFTDLNETPSSFSGQANKIPAVNAGETALEFIDNTDAFTELTDTPSSLSGEGGKTVSVNSGGTALEFVDLKNRLASAWVNFDGTGVASIRDSYNVSSITDNGVGLYTVNFTTPLDNSNGVIVGSIADTNAGTLTQLEPGVLTVNNAPVQTVFTNTSAITLFDATYINVAVFGGC